MSRRILRSTAAVALTAALAVGSALPASAHASFDKSQVPADSDVSLTFRAPTERASTNVRIETLVPRQWDVLDCSTTVGWTCDVDTTSAAPMTIVEWVARPGAVPAINFDFAVHTPSADEQGVYLFPVIQTYADGHEAKWINEGEPGPAPRVQVGDENAEVVDNSAPAESHDGTPSDPEPTSSPSPTPTSQPTSQPTTQASPTTRPTTSPSTPPSSTTTTTTDSEPTQDEAPEASAPTATTATAPAPAATREATTSTDATAGADSAPTLAAAETDAGGSPVLPILGGLALAGAAATFAIRRRTA